MTSRRIVRPAGGELGTVVKLLTEIRDLLRTPEPPAEEKKYYSVAETAELLGLSPETLYRQIHAGRLPAVQFGKRFIIPARVLDDLEDQAFN